MERNYEDKLMDLAFGELNPEEAARLEARMEAEPNAARDLAFTRTMREDLLALSRDVPADQLSKERLRQAILGNGLHPMPMRRPLGLGWLWAPATAFVAAFVLVLLRSQSGEPAYVAKTERTESPRVTPIRPRSSAKTERVAANTARPTLGLDAFAAGSAALAGYEDEVVEPTAQPVEEVKIVEEADSHRAQEIIEEGGPAKVPGMDDGVRELVGNPGPGTLVNNPRGKRPDGDVNANFENLAQREPIATGMDSTIVLIRPDQNRQTGAQTATEMEKENVLVGG